MTEDRFVYSTDPDENREIRRRAAEARAGKANEPVDLEALVVNIRVERKGRRGKVVTVADGLPANEAFLAGLTKRLKKTCGAGGTFKIVEARAGNEGRVEIQGDGRDRVGALLAADGIRTRNG